MHDLTIPEIEDRSVFDNCVAVKAKPLRDRFITASDLIHAAAELYADKASQGDLIDIQTIVNADLGVTKAELTALYNNQLVDKRGPERRTYDKILLAARRCPFCSHRPPRTLDHYLPKESFSEFAIFSGNLVPCCRDCNSEKLSRILTDDEQLLHPYFDKVTDFDWLHCEISFEGNAPIYRFFVSDTADIPPKLFKKMTYQMSELGLDTLYALEAADEVGGVRAHMIDVFDVAGAEGVRIFLGEQADSRLRYDRNSWQAALYRAASFNDKFCEMDWMV